MDSHTVEIERTYLLDRMPDLPAGAFPLRIEQGYLTDNPAATLEGRLRRTVHPDGRVVYTNTIKRGSGLVRSESQREISLEEFDEHWPQTLGRRVTKTRWIVHDGGLTWEIDQFDDLELFLAEVELPDDQTQVTPPPWLAPHIVRDVTDENEYGNYQIALDIARRKGDAP